MKMPDVSFCRDSPMRLTRIQNEGVFEKMDGAFDGYAVAIEFVPLLRIS